METVFKMSFQFAFLKMKNSLAEQYDKLECLFERCKVLQKNETESRRHLLLREEAIIQLNDEIAQLKAEIVNKKIKTASI